MSTVATLVLQGIVPAILNISVAAEPIATSLPLDTTQLNTKIATIQERSNNASGYKVQISSTNFGALTNGSESIPYSLTYDNQNVVLTSPDEFSHSVTGTNSRDLKISYNGEDNENRESGDYTDTLTFTISAN